MDLARSLLRLRLERASEMSERSLVEDTIPAKLEDEVDSWIVEHFGAYTGRDGPWDWFADTDAGRYYYSFKREDDAMLFKLRWIG